MKTLALFGLVLFVSVSCSAVHLVHVSDMKPNVDMKASTILKVKSSQSVILWFVFDTKYVDRAYVALQKNCAGTVHGIVTSYSTYMIFPYWKNSIMMQAICTPPKDSVSMVKGASVN